MGQDAQSFLAHHRVMLAPMAGVSDAAMRALCREQGAQLAFTEMVSAKGLSYANERTRHIVDLGPDESEVGVQIFGHEPLTMAQQASWIEDELGSCLAVLDINMGCPVRKIVSKGDGAALMTDPDLASCIVREVSRAVSVPVSVKFRRGFDRGTETAPEFARRMEQAGASYLTVHGRFAQQMYTGSADWGSIARTRAAVSIPVVGNGDISSGADALRMMDETGCEAVMVARAAEGNPWVFADIAAALAGLPLPAPPTPTQRIAMARRHAHLLDQANPRSVVRMRKHGSWYCKGLAGAASARAALNSCTTIEDFDATFDVLADKARGR